MTEDLAKPPENAETTTQTIKSTIPDCPAGTTRPVFTFEILRYAKRNCSLCHGAGIYAVKYDTKDVSVEQVCGCAMRKFAKWHTSDIAFDGKGQLFWREGKDPKADEISAVKQLAQTDTTI